MTFRRTGSAPFALSLVAALAACATNTKAPRSAQAFAGEIQDLLDRRDLIAINQLISDDSYPPARRSMLIDLADACLADDRRCRVEAVEPAPDAFEPEPWAASAVPPGVTEALAVESTDAGHRRLLPIAPRDGRYRLLAGEPTAETVAMSRIVQHPRERLAAHLAEVLAAVLDHRRRTAAPDAAAPAATAEEALAHAREVLAQAERGAPDADVMAAYRRYLQARRHGDAAWLAAHGTLDQRRMAERLAAMPPRPDAAILQELDAAFAFSGEIAALDGLRQADCAGFAMHGMTGAGWPAGGVAVLCRTGDGWEMVSERVDFWPPQG